MTITQITKADADKAKRDRLKHLEEEYERLSMEGIALIDARMPHATIEEVINRRREIMKRMEEIKQCLNK
jgi:hypothetical protein